MQVPAVVMAGDRGSARAVYGQSKVYLELDGRPLVAHVVAALQRVPEVSEIWVVGDSARLEVALGDERLERELVKPLHIVPQFRNLYENAWEAYRRLLPGAGSAGRDPTGEDAERAVLYVSADLPFATPQEISEFARRSLEIGCDYAFGLVAEEALEEFYPDAPGAPGIRMAYFNLREGRVRLTNLHLVKPARLVNRYYVQAMYEHRYQKQFGNMVAVAWRLVRSERGGLRVLFYYLLMQLAGITHRWGLRRLADFLRRWIPIARVEAVVSQLLRASFRAVTTEAGGCAVDIDGEKDYEAARECFARWRDAQAKRAEKLYGPPALREGARERSKA